MPPPIIWDLGFQSGNILAVGASEPMRGLYIYQLEATGSTTYLTKVTAPDGAADYFGRSVSRRAIFLPSGIPADPGGYPELGLLIFIDWKPMIGPT